MLDSLPEQSIFFNTVESFWSYSQGIATASTLPDFNASNPAPAESDPNYTVDRLLELISDLVEARLGADLVALAAGRTGYADRADGFVPHFDRQRTS